MWSLQSGALVGAPKCKYSPLKGDLPFFQCLLTKTASSDFLLRSLCPWRFCFAYNEDKMFTSFFWSFFKVSPLFYWQTWFKNAFYTLPSTKTKNKMKSTFILWVRQSQNGRRVIAKALSPRLLRNTVPCMEALFISEGLCDYLTISTVGILCWNSVFSASDSWLALTGNQSLPTGDLLFSYQHTKVQTSKSSLLRVTSTF